MEHIGKLYKDPLTRLYNREYFNRIVQRQSFSFLFIDINNFKLINDNFGHLV
jgi:diguanylate cyclase (GGDEF)-like protein